MLRGTRCGMVDPLQSVPALTRPTTTMTMLPDLTDPCNCHLQNPVDMGLSVYPPSSGCLAATAIHTYLRSLWYCHGGGTNKRLVVWLRARVSTFDYTLNVRVLTTSSKGAEGRRWCQDASGHREGDFRMASSTQVSSW